MRVWCGERVVRWPMPPVPVTWLFVWVFSVCTLIFHHTFKPRCRYWVGLYTDTQDLRWYVDDTASVPFATCPTTAMLRGDYSWTHRTFGNTSVFDFLPRGCWESTPFLFCWAGIGQSTCAVISHPTFGTKCYPATFFTDAPLDCILEAIEELTDCNE